MWLVAFSLLARADCPEDTLPIVRTNAAAMEVAYASLDEAAFDAARAELEAALPCVGAPLEKADVLGLHRSMALAFFADGDMRATQKSWGAVKALKPGWQPSEALAPPEHLLRQLFDDASTGGERIELALEPEGGWIVDGSWTSSVPAEQAFVLQALGEEGVYYTGYQLSVAGIPITDLVQPGPSPRARKVRKVGSITAAGLAAGSLAALALHLQTQSQLDSASYGEVDALAARATASGIGAGALGAGAVGVFVTAWAVKW